MFAVNSCAFSRYLFLAGVRDRYTDVWADPTALYACIFFCYRVLVAIVPLQQQQDYRAVRKSEINFSLCGFLCC